VSARKAYRMANVVIITGSSSGIGLLSALTFARQGDRVYATMRDRSRGDALASAAEAEGLAINSAELDVTDDTSVERAVGHVLAAEGRIDVLVNNAGVQHFGSVELLPDELMRSTFETNLFGAVRMIRAVVPGMRARGSGAIINVSSLAGRERFGMPICWSYYASKHSLSALSDSLAWELEPYGITVACVEPDFFVTPIVAKAARPSDSNSPYQALERAVVGSFERDMADGGDAQLVADAIVAAVHGTTDRSVHVLVGEHAEKFLETHASMSELDYKAEVREWLGFEPSPEDSQGTREAEGTQRPPEPTADSESPARPRATRRIASAHLGSNHDTA
jgi:NAD(P)-dependent dehydrogenase (short-subunit alcohol dehydrogenase family)